MNAQTIADSVNLLCESLVQRGNRWHASYLPPRCLDKLYSVNTYAKHMAKAGGRLTSFGVSFHEDATPKAVEVTFTIDGE